MHATKTSSSIHSVSLPLPALPPVPRQPVFFAARRSRFLSAAIFYRCIVAAGQILSCVFFRHGDPVSRLVCMFLCRFQSCPRCPFADVGILAHSGHPYVRILIGFCLYFVQSSLSLAVYRSQEDQVEVSGCIVAQTSAKTSAAALGTGGPVCVLVRFLGLVLVHFVSFREICVFEAPGSKERCGGSMSAVENRQPGVVSAVCFVSAARSTEQRQTQS